jgi:ABC transporter substrate binding protein/AAA ATPase domain
MAIHIGRREFMAALSGAAAAWPLAARTQEAMPVIGLLSTFSSTAAGSNLGGLKQGLNETGYSENQNVAIEYRWAEGHYDRLPGLMADLVGRRVAVIVAWGPPAARVAKAATSTIPIVFSSGDDPVQIGLVPSMNRPGGNVTGVYLLFSELGAKKLGLLQLRAVCGKTACTDLCGGARGNSRLYRDRREFITLVGGATAATLGVSVTLVFTHSHRTQGWLIVESSSVSYGKASSFLPIIDLLRAYFQIEAGDEARRIREKVTGKLLSLDRVLEPSLPALLWLLDVPVEDPQWQKLDAPQRRQQALNGVKRLLLRESQVQPVLVLFEDLHWIDAETQALLGSLVESLPTGRLLLLVNYRPEYRHGWSGKTYYRQLRIDPLPPESAEQLLDSLLGKDSGLQSLKRLLIERTQGNPFFLEESVRTLVESKALAGERGAYRLAKASETFQIPATAQAILAARIDRLSPEDKRLLQAASVIGKDVPFGLLQAIAEEGEESLRRGLSHLQAAEFLYEARSWIGVAHNYEHPAFRH